MNHPSTDLRFSAVRIPCPACGSSRGFAPLIGYSDSGKCFSCETFIPPGERRDYRDVFKPIPPIPPVPPVPRVPRVPRSPMERKETGRFLFHDESGRVVAAKVRYDFVDEQGEPGKTFVMNPAGTSVPLYRLPCILSAARQGHQIFAVEGERKSDLLELFIREEWGIDAAATSFSHWKRGFAEHFRGASQVVLMPDRDETGQRKSRVVADDLRAIAPVVIRSWEEPTV